MGKKEKEAIEMMKRRNNGELAAKQLLTELEELLGTDGMDMLALWGLMMANEAADRMSDIMHGRRDF